VSTNVSEELQTAYQALSELVIISETVHWNEDSVNLCDIMDVEYPTLLYYFEEHLLSRAKVLRRLFEIKQEIIIFLSHSNNRDDEN
jgi:hypothetical protein